MNRRSFLKSAALAAVAVPVVGLPAMPVPVAPAMHPSPATSILLQWYYPGATSHGHNHKYWNTPTLEAWQEAKFEALLLWAGLAGRGYTVDYHEFDVIRFVHRQ